MLKNFSPPMSEPKPASVSTYPLLPTSLSASLSATTDEFPCAMLAKGPQCTSTGVCSSVCIVVGCSASMRRTVRAPVMPKSSAVSGSPLFEKAAIMLPSRLRRSAKSLASARTAMISDATVIAKPASRSKRSPVFFAISAAPRPSVTLRTNRSFVSVTRHHVMESGSMSSRTKRSICASVSAAGSEVGSPSLRSRGSILSSKTRLPSLSGGQSLSNMNLVDAVRSWKYRVSIAAENRLLAAVMA
mmetsp:Transcript_8713/g.22735  ORF Transcript_8713/g.22735 Transcript_8713/m.22735 type:complete len:244 (-) Transcript_8713:576-1307(-)